MKRGSYRRTQLAAANDEPGLFEGHVIFRSYHPDIPPQRGRAIDPSMACPHVGDMSRGSSRYCDQPADWRTRLFGLAGTASIIGLVLAGALFTWKVVHPRIAATSRPLTVVNLAPLAAPPKPVREVAPGPEQVERQEAKPEPKREMLPVPLIQLPTTSSVKADMQKPVEIVDPGPSVPETTAPKNIAAPTVNRLASEAKPNWEGVIVAHLERFRRYPARARAARQQGVAYVRFKMNRAGMVLSSTILQKSGSFDLDQAALDTLQRAQPLPAIPAERPDVVELTIPVEFKLR